MRGLHVHMQQSWYLQEASPQKVKVLTQIGFSVAFVGGFG
jgi:hypothetical protein